MGGVAIVVFSDLVESTALLARLGDERMDRIRRAHVRDVAKAVSGGGGGRNNPKSPLIPAHRRHFRH